MEALETARSRRTQAERSAATRAELIEATIALLLEQGLANCSLAAVAKRAGLTTGAVQHQFQTKARLMRAVIAKRLFAAESSVSTKQLSALALEDRCRALVELQWSIYRQPQYLAIWEIILGAKTDQDIQREISTWQESATRAHESVIQTILADCDLTDSKIRSLQYFLNAHLRGLAMLRTVEDNQAIVDQQLELLGQAILSLVKDKCRHSSGELTNEKRDRL